MPGCCEVHTKIMRCHVIEVLQRLALGAALALLLGGMSVLNVAAP